VAVLLAIPNVSEGRDSEVIDAIGSGYLEAGGEDVRLLDVHADPDHHRAVHTLAGPPGALSVALAGGAQAAIARIDLTRERGIHPHVGALDVAPIVFLDQGLRGAACAEALVAAARLGELGLPVFLYGILGDGRTRAELRRGGIEELTRRMAEGLRADFGPRGPHPTAGAVLVGARAPLIAFNLELAPPAGVREARAIAGLIRESGPQGLPGVRALGLELTARGGIAQVSTNVEDHRRVSLADVVAAVSEHAVVAECELVGLAPEAAFAGFPEDLTVRNRRTVEEAL
jgi:glutamate formiminotransferase